MRNIYKVLSAFLSLKHSYIAAFTLMAAGILFSLFHYFDSLPSTFIDDHFALDIFVIRESTINFLFRVAPFFITLVLAITSLTINTYSGTFLDLLLSDKKIKLFIVYSLLFLAFHIIVIFIIKSSLPLDPTLLKDYYVENFCIYLLEFILSFINSVFSLYIAYKVFQYSWPVTLRQKFLKNIRKTLHEVEYRTIGKKEEINNFKAELNQQLGLFVNLIFKAIKSKDYDSTRDILIDIKVIWNEIISYTNIDKQEEDDQHFKEVLKRITNENPDLGLQFDFAGDIYEIGLSKIAHVFTESFEIAFSTGEYYICELILDSTYNLIDLNENEGSKLDESSDEYREEDIRKCLKILVEIFEVSLRFDKKGRTLLFAEKTLSYINNIYRETKFKDFDIYYDIIFFCLKLNDPKILKESMLSFKKVFDLKSNGDKILYRDTIAQFQGTLIYCLKYKRMNCFAELIRFFVVNGLELDVVNQVFSEKIIVENDLELLQDFIDELTDDLSNLYNRENYIRVKLYLVWYSYYLLQCRISKERVLLKYRSLQIPDSIKSKVPFELIRTVLLDLETHQSNWKKLFVGQEEYYFPRIALALLNEKENKMIEFEIEKFGNSGLLKKAYEIYLRL